MSFLEKLKQRWGITSNWRLVKILLIFSLTGMSAVQVRKIVFPLVGITPDTGLFIKIISWLVLVTPAYYLFTVIYSVLLGEKDFFFGMMQKTFSRFKRKK
ncbi:MAG: prolipoprotein diacylglyceryl transferase [Cytophagales bacterium]|nr:prolipoprotein diacylglyceryl transferase [Cytophaga sp.]